MKLYIVRRTDDVSWEEYISFVVAAESEENALEWTPSHTKLSEDEWGWNASVTKDDLEIECIGESYSTEEKVIHTSFLHG